jgi:hypothetical protein
MSPARRIAKIRAVEEALISIADTWNFKQE